jgi:hypothetical protein
VGSDRIRSRRISRDELDDRLDGGLVRAQGRKVGHDDDLESGVDRCGRREEVVEVASGRRFVGTEDVDRKARDAGRDRHLHLLLHVVDDVRRARPDRDRQRALPNVSAVGEPLVALAGWREIVPVVVVDVARDVVDRERERIEVVGEHLLARREQRRRRRHREREARVRGWGSVNGRVAQCVWQHLVWRVLGLGDGAVSIAIARGASIP